MKGYLLDTNVLSEGAKQRPDTRVGEWLRQGDPQTQFVSVLSLAEIRRGALRALDPRKSAALERWLYDLLLRQYSDRVLPVDWRVAETWAGLAARCESAGRTLPVVDALLAATALANDLVIVTRNVRDFQPAGVSVLDPWSR
ncbi:MAG: type II toxin-antitoxin system VapC family toxin [Candidatus Solibacter usitatus]|nr:type II toxin-antitoxin system VapC family toxin [Candidatus Solibacter usitatus]